MVGPLLQTKISNVKAARSVRFQYVYAGRTVPRPLLLLFVHLKMKAGVCYISFIKCFEKDKSRFRGYEAKAEAVANCPPLADGQMRQTSRMGTVTIAAGHIHPSCYLSTFRH